jgi:hypothetical protein
MATIRNKIEQGLDAVGVKSDWQIQVERKNALYFPIGSFGPWINAYDPPAYPGPANLIQGSVRQLTTQIDRTPLPLFPPRETIFKQTIIVDQRWANRFLVVCRDFRSAGRPMTGG